MSYIQSLLIHDSTVLQRSITKLVRGYLGTACRRQLVLHHLQSSEHLGNLCNTEA